MSSRTVDRALGSANKTVTVSKTVQDAILKNIIGHYNQDEEEEETSGDESVTEAVTKITESKELDQEEAAFQDRLAKMKKKIRSEVRAGKHGDVKIEETILKNTEKEEEGMKHKKLEDEVQSLKDELKELKEHIKNKNSASPSSSSNSSFSHDDDDESDEEDEQDRPVNILDIFKTTILKKSKTTKSTFKDSDNPSLKKSKLVESKTRKILKERIQMRNKSKM